MSQDAEEEIEMLENVDEVMDSLTKELQDLFTYRDMFFENHPIEMAKQKNDLVEEKKNILVEKLEKIDVDRQIPFPLRAQFLYMKGRCFNIEAVYDPRAAHYLSKAIKLNPHFVGAWNELGECYWKNLNIKDAKASFEAAMKHERNRVSLRCLSIILRQEIGKKKRKEAIPMILKSVDLAKEAVALDIKDGLSWSVLGNAYLCQFFMVAQDPAVLKSSMSSYKQAYMDPIAKGQPDLHYNQGIALKYSEDYAGALSSFEHACRFDPSWEPPQVELGRLRSYLTATYEIVRTRGSIKSKRLLQMMQTMDDRFLGIYVPGSFHTFGTRRDVLLERVEIAALREGSNEGKVIVGKVVGSIHCESGVPFTFVIVDKSLRCVAVTVYNWADGRGAIIGDCVCIPEPTLTAHDLNLSTLQFMSIRVNNPLLLVINGKRLRKSQFASTMVTSTFQIY